jgi:hypothetical protein
VHEWNFSFQRELPWDLVMQASYIGRRGERLFMAYDANQIAVEPILPSFEQMQQGAPRTSTPLFGQLVTGFIANGRTPAQATADATSFLNSSTTTGELTTNNIGNFARRIEDSVLSLRLRPNQQFGVITYISNEGDSNYHAAQFTLRRRFSSGLGLSMAYTFGKSIDNQSVDPSEPRQVAVCRPQTQGRRPTFAISVVSAAARTLTARMC